jgi:hypothetical protein
MSDYYVGGFLQKKHFDSEGKRKAAKVGPGQKELPGN